MKTEIIDSRPASIARAAERLAAGDIVAFPTETVYGLGARADNGDAVAKIFVAKGRPENKPLILHVADVEQARAATTGWDARADAIAAAFWPGPVSMVLRRAAWVPDVVTGGGDTVAVRAPAHDVALALIAACGCAIAAPSANRAGADPPTNARGVLATLDGRIPLVIDAGETPVTIPSTLVSLVDDEARILRLGAVSREQLEAVVVLAR